MCTTLVIAILKNVGNRIKNRKIISEEIPFPKREFEIPVEISGRFRFLRFFFPLDVEKKYRIHVGGVRKKKVYINGSTVQYNSNVVN